MEAGVPVAVCSTSNERAVSTIVRVLLGPEVAAKMRVFVSEPTRARARVRACVFVCSTQVWGGRGGCRAQ